MTLYEIRSSRWGNVVFILATFVLLAVVLDVVFLPEHDLLPIAWERAEFSTAWKIGSGLLVLVGVFMLGVLIYRFIKRPVEFRMTEDGFEYNPGGVSTGWIRWTDVEKIDFTLVRTGGPNVAAKVRCPGIFLKDPAGYIARQPAPLRPLFEMREMESGTPLVFTAGEFRHEQGKVIALMRQQVARANGVARR